MTQHAALLYLHFMIFCLSCAMCCIALEHVVILSVCHTRGLCENSSTYQTIFTM